MYILYLFVYKNNMLVKQLNKDDINLFIAWLGTCICIKSFSLNSCRLTSIQNAKRKTKIKRNLDLKQHSFRKVFIPTLLKKKTIPIYLNFYKLTFLKKILTVVCNFLFFIVYSQRHYSEFKIRGLEICHKDKTIPFCSL